MMPSQEEIEQAQSDFRNALLPDTGNVLEIQRASDGQGGFTDSWGTATMGTAVPCRLDAFSSKGSSNPQGNESLAGGAIGSFGRWILTLAANQEIDTENRFECNGRTFNVITVDNAKSWEITRRCILEQT